MPFTAFHIGPALVAKAIFPKTISLRAFVATQVAIDSEPLFRMFAGIEPLHGPFHTVIGALLVSLVAVLLYRWWARRHGHVLGWKAVADTTVFGALSHMWLDVMSHHDVGSRYMAIEPNWTPDYDAAVVLCVVSGVVGAVLWLMRTAFAFARQEERRQQRTEIAVASVGVRHRAPD